MVDETKNPKDTPNPNAGAQDIKGASAAQAPDPAQQEVLLDTGMLEGQIGDLTDRLLRAHAEMDNLRKRTERERQEAAKYSISNFAREILTIGDNLQRAIAAVPEGAAEQDPALKGLIDGVAMTEREFTNVLERNGVKRIDPAGEPFDPHQHQAMSEVENPEVAAGTIVQVFQPGYIIEDRVLRPAMVVVAKGGTKPVKAADQAADVSAANDDGPPNDGNVGQNA